MKRNGNKKREKREFWTGDIETDPFYPNRIPQAFDIGFYDGKNHVEFWGETAIKQAISFLSERRAIVYFHNGGKFDFHFLLPYIPPEELEVFLIDSRIVKMRWKDVEFRDSYAILPIALKKTGNKKDIDYWKLEANCDALTLEQVKEFRKESHLTDGSPREFYREEIQSYRRQDNKALYDMVKAFIAEYGSGLTISGRAFNELKKVGITPPKGNETFDSKLRPFYYGGRVQCFETGILNGSFKIVDINSAYPFAMLSAHWWGLEHLTTSKLPKDRTRLGASFIELECFSNGALPVRKKGGGIEFPTGKGFFRVSGWEYLAGIDLGLISEINIIKTFVPHSIRDFSPFVNKFYLKKLAAEKAGDSEGRLFAKLFLNSSYGRFAINPRKFREHKLLPLGEQPELEDDENANDWELVALMDDVGMGVWERSVDPEEWEFFNVATAASITGYVRAYLLRAIAKVTRPLYCDTDSIICEEIGELPLGQQLGDWSLDAEGDRVAIAGKKLYAFRTLKGDHKIASKGVRLAASEIEAIANGKTVNWKNVAPSFSLKSTPKFIERNIRKTT